MLLQFREFSFILFLFVIALILLSRVAKTDLQFKFYLTIGLTFKIVFVLIMFFVAQNLVFSLDALRYLNEIQLIATDPFAWNPFTGEGPGYSSTPKMGMSYLYGFALYLFRVQSVVCVLGFHLFVSWVTVLLTISLAQLICFNDFQIRLTAFLALIHPEILIWSDRLLRESLTQLLIVAMALAVISIRKKQNMVFAYISLGFVLIALFLTRVQLTVIFFVMLAYMLLSNFKLNIKFFLNALVVVLISLFGLNYIKSQIAKAAGNHFAEFLSLNPDLWLSEMSTFCENFFRVVSITSRGGYGGFEIILAPFSIATFLVLFLSLIKSRDIFRQKRWEGGLLVFVTLVFYFGLIVAGMENVRFRTPVAPLIIPLLSMSIYWLHFKMREFREIGRNEISVKD